MYTNNIMNNRESIYFVEITVQYGNNVFKHNRDSLSYFGITTQQAMDKYKDCYADVKIIKYTILNDKVLLLLSVKQDLPKNPVRFINLIPHGIYAVTNQIKSDVSKTTGVYIWNRSSQIYTVRDKSDYNTIFNSMEESTTLK